MLHDIIYRQSAVDSTQPTRLLPYDFLRKYIPLSLEVKDTFNLRGHIPIDTGHPLMVRRVFYLEDIDCYLVVDIGNPAMPMLYLVDGTTHEMKCSYTYLVENYLDYKPQDQITDVCVHHSNMQGHVTVTFLTINNSIRSSSVATYNLEYGRLGDPNNGDDEAGPIFYIELLDLVHFADVIPPGKKDEIALGFTEKSSGGMDNHIYPEFLVEDLVPTLKSRLFMGTFVPKYCTITCDDKGRFIILLATTIDVWMGPFLKFPVDAQYIIIMDKGGMNIKFSLLSPAENAMSFDEHQENQPYKYSLSVWDGRYLICLEDRKCRYLSPLLVYVPMNTLNIAVGADPHYLYSDQNWDGGVVADVYYPMRKNTSRGVGTTIYNSYCTRWEPTAYLDPIQRETVWVTISICDILKDFLPYPATENPTEKTADIIFLIDDSSTMQTAINRVQTNVGALADRLSDLGITGTQYGITLYQGGTGGQVQLPVAPFTFPVLTTSLTNVGMMIGQARASNLTASPPVPSLTELNRGLDTPTRASITTAAQAASYNSQNLTDPWAAIDFAVANYTMRPEAVKVFILVTDTIDEIQHLTQSRFYQSLSPAAKAQSIACTPSSSHSELTALTSLASDNVILCAVSPKWTKSTYNTLVEGTGGVYIEMTSSDWGPAMADQVAEMIASKTNSISSTAPSDWFGYVTQRWGPAIYYHYTPALDFEANSLITVFHDDVTFMVNGAIVRNQINWLGCYDNYPQLGGEAQDSFYLPSLVPGESTTQLFVVRNESYTGTMKKIQLQLLDKPDDVDITVENWPEELKSRQQHAVTITATYNPPDDADVPPERHLDIHYNMSYWMTHVLTCRVGAEDSERDDYPDMPELYDETDLYFTEDNQANSFSAGFIKSIEFDPMYTLAYVTTTDYKEDDLVEQESWSDRLYILTKEIVNSESFERVQPVPITAIAGYDTATTGCCWLKVRGPVIWTTTRKYECKANTKTWYIVNQSTSRTYVAHPVMDEETAPEHQGMGFILFEYPEGNIIPPGESRPVTIKWQPIFNPDGEDMTRRTTRPVVRNCQAESVGSIWSTEDGFFNNLLFAMAIGQRDATGNVIGQPDYDTEFTHTYVETIFGDGMDIPVRPDQPLHKMDVKQLNTTPYHYNTLTYFDVDLDQVEDDFQFLTRAGIWMGVKDDPEANDLPLPLGAKPSDMFDYIEWISPASGLDEVPQYIDHKFKVNPLYTFNAGSPYPYQLAPFNSEYADPYVATMFMGHDTIQTKDVANSGYEDWNQYVDPTALIVPCDSSGTEQAGWLIQNFWPVPGDRDTSIARLATENDYIFTKTFYALNKDATNSHQIVLDYDANVINGVSVQGVTVTANATCPPGGVATIDVSFRLHYTYQESHCVNLVKDILYIPVFIEDA